MKIIKTTITLVIALLISMQAFAHESVDSSIKETIMRFATGVDKQSVKMSKAVLHKKYVENYFYKGALQTGNRSDYLKLIANKIIGGNKRELHISHVNHAGLFATVNAEMESDKLHFDHFFNLYNDNGKWKIIHNVLSIRPVSNDKK